LQIHYITNLKFVKVRVDYEPMQRAIHKYRQECPVQYSYRLYNVREYNVKPVGVVTSRQPGAVQLAGLFLSVCLHFNVTQVSETCK